MFRAVLIAALWAVFSWPALAGPNGFEVGEEAGFGYACTYNAAETIADAAAQHSTTLAKQRHTLAAEHGLCQSIPGAMGKIVGVENMTDVDGVEIQLLKITFAGLEGREYGLVVTRKAAIEFWERSQGEAT